MVCLKGSVLLRVNFEVSGRLELILRDWGEGSGLVSFFKALCCLGLMFKYWGRL